MRCPKCGLENLPDARLCSNCQEILPTASPGQSQRPPAQGSRFCVSCGRAISWEANVCPYCGHNYMAPPPQYGPPHEEISSGMKILFYVLSLLVPIAGIIIGVILLATKHDEQSRHIGKMCLLLAVLAILIPIVLALVLYAAVLGFGAA